MILSLYFVHHVILHHTNLYPAMQLAVVPQPQSIQRLVAPILALDRAQQDMERSLYDLVDVEDDLLDLGIYNVPRMLHQVTHQLRLAIAQIKIHKLILFCQLQRALHAQWRQHGIFPWLDLEL